MDKKDKFNKIIVSWYYSMTTLTTVGYGDYYPISNTEIFVAVCYMLCGVVFFSYIMGYTTSLGYSSLLPGISCKLIDPGLAT